MHSELIKAELKQCTMVDATGWGLVGKEMLVKWYKVPLTGSIF